MTLDPTAAAQAAQRLSGIVNRTPVMTSRTLNKLTGREIFCKCEDFQCVGAFKFRGAYNAVSQLSFVLFVGAHPCVRPKYTHTLGSGLRTLWADTRVCPYTRVLHYRTNL